MKALVWRVVQVAALGSAVVLVTAAILAMRVMGVTVRGLVDHFGPLTRKVVPLSLGRLIGPFLPFYALTWHLVGSGSAERVTWLAAGLAITIVYAVGLRRSSWIARFEPEHLPESETPLGYSPRRTDDRRLHELTRLHVSYVLPLTAVLATQPITFEPATLLVLGFACIYLHVGFADYEICTHWNMHAQSLAPADPSVRVRPAVARVLMEYVVGFVNGYVPGVYPVNHMLVHHRANSGKRDPHSPLPYRRTSYFEFCLFAVRVTSSMSFGFPLGLTRDTPRRVWANVYVHIVGAWLFCTALLVSGRVLGLVLVLSVVRHGIMVAADQIVWHGLIDPDDAGHLGRTTLWVSSGVYLDGLFEEQPDRSLRVPKPAEAWPFFDNFHLLHHMNTRLHFTEYEAELVIQWPRIRDARSVVMAWRRMDEFVFDCWAGRLELIGTHLLTEVDDNDAKIGFVRRHLQPDPTIRSTFASVVEGTRCARLERVVTRAVCATTGNGWA